MTQEARDILARIVSDIDALIAAVPNLDEADPSRDMLCEIVGHLAFARGYAIAEIADRP